MLLAGLVVALLGLAVWYGSVPADPTMARFPNAGDLAGAYADHVGDRALVTGRVVETDPVVIHASTSLGTLPLVVEAIDRPVERGDRIQVFGVVLADHGIRSLNAVEAGNRGYAWAISALAVLWVFARAIRHWRIDLGSLSVVPRTGNVPISPDTERDSSDA